jgi:glycosyltransferase involved in cell wall biosynthesis
MKLKVLHVTESLVPDAGSVAISLPGLFRALGANGIESDSAALDGNETRAADLAEIKRLVERADVVHLHGWGHPRGRWMARAARRASKPYVVSPHGALGQGPHTKRNWRTRVHQLLRDRRLIRQAAAVTGLNEAEERDLKSRRGNARICLLPYGVDLDDYEFVRESSRETGPRGTQGDGEAAPLLDDGWLGRGSKLLLMLGPIHPIEGFVPLLKAFSEIGPDSDGWSVVLAGRETGDWRKMLEAAIRRKGEENRVKVTSAPDVPTQRAWLARASLLAAPSLQIRCPVSVMQAVAAGVPVLASSHAAPAGLDGAIHVCGTTRDDLKGGLRSLFALSDSDRTALGRRARDIGRSVLDWSVLVDHYVRLYQSLV